VRRGSGAFARMLDQEGVWCYPFAGGLTLEHSDGMWHFGAFSSPEAKAEAGHMWVRVPPFQVIDIALPFQGWESGIQCHFEGPVVSEISTPYGATERELFDGEYLTDLGAGKTDRTRAQRLIEDNLRFMERFQAFTVFHHRLNLHYVPVGTKMSPVGLQEMTWPVLNGMDPSELYEDFKSRQAAGANGSWL